MSVFFQSLIFRVICTLSYESSWDRGEPILSYNKPRWDFDFKQRPSLAYYNKGSAWFIITKAFFATLFPENEEQPSEKNLIAMFLGRNNAHMPKFRPLRNNFFFHPNRHLALTPSIGSFLPSFQCTSFIFLWLRSSISSWGRNYLISSNKLVFMCVFRLYFLVFSQMLRIILKEWKFCCTRLHFVLWSQK